ncbi:MAG: hypothetical protein M1812_004882 [Candelaria pacifica]|nr:MAG: hypothetical protein M1812_004882 [Candelaria pacifica]
MSTPLQKRQRADTAGASNPPPTISLNTITSLPKPMIADLLLTAANTHADIATLINNAHTAMRSARCKQKINFDHYSKSAWHSLNISYKGLSGSKEYNMAGKVQNEVSSIITHILKKIHSDSSFETKESASSTLRKIGKSVELCDLPVIRKEVRNGGLLGELGDGMAKVVKCMTIEERQRIVRERELVPKIKELRGLADGEMEVLREVVDILNGKVIELYESAGEEDSDDYGKDEDEDSDEDGDGDY